MKKVNLTIPKSWDDLSPTQLKKIGVLFHQQNSLTAVNYLILKILLNVKWYSFYKKIQIHQLLRQVPLSVLSNYWHYLTLDCTRTNFIPIKGYNAPGSRIHNLTIGEFAVTEDLFKQYLQTQNNTYLKYLTAVLYTQQKGMLRPTFNKEMLNVLVAKLPKINHPTLYAVALCYMGSRNSLIKKYPLAFPADSSVSESETSGLNPVILQMAGKKFGTYNQTNQTNVYLFFEEYQENLKQLKHAKHL